MAALSVRALDDEVKDRLRVRAAENGRSMEAEVRTILTAAVSGPQPPGGLLTALRERFAQLGGVELDIPPRTTMPRAADFRQ